MIAFCWSADVISGAVCHIVVAIALGWASEIQKGHRRTSLQPAPFQSCLTRYLHGQTLVASAVAKT